MIFGHFLKISFRCWLRLWFEAPACLEMEPGELIDGIKVLTSAPQVASRFLLLLNGSRDNIVSLRQAERIYESTGHPKGPILLKGIGHLCYALF